MTDNVYTYIKSNVEPFLLDPPDTDFQQGYLAALLNVAEEALGLHLAKSPFKEAQKLCSPIGKMNWLQREITLIGIEIGVGLGDPLALLVQKFGE